MASLERRNQSFRVVFMYAGRKYGYSLGTGDREMAEALRGGVEKTLMLLEQKLLRIPDGAGIIDFVRNGGKVEEPTTPAPERLAFVAFKCQYLAAHRNGVMEANSFATVAMHLGHFERTLGARFLVPGLTLADLQRHVNARSQKKYRGRKLSPVTLRKEMASLRAAWNWAAHTGLLRGTFPGKGLIYPKGDEKPPFMTWAEIERRLPGLSDAEQKDLWDCLFLTLPEIAALLDHVHTHASQPWVYPAVCFAAHTGARRSEIFRVRIADVDFTGETVLIHEKKRARGKRTTRRVTLSPFLIETLQVWLANHPGGSFLFSQNAKIVRSKTRRSAATPVTRDDAHDHLQRTLAGSKWQVLKGWHTLRHSFISCCAAQRLDQRVIDAWVGHTTEEMRRRYRHLIPSIEKEAIRSVFAE